jgi:hypothetical protein
MRPNLYTDDYARQCESHPKYIESISKYTSTLEDGRRENRDVEGKRESEYESGGKKGHEAMEETRPHIPRFRGQR